MLHYEIIHRNAAFLLPLLILLIGSVLATPTLTTSAGSIRDSAPDSSPFGWKKCPNSNDDRWRCGSIKVPYNHNDASDNRTMQIETVLFQVGKTRAAHTIVVNPGGPGASGVGYVWYAAETISRTYSDNTFDVLGFDPRGINASEPHIYCYPNYAYQDRWTQIGNYYKEKGDKMADLQLWDSMSEAFFKACRLKYGDLGDYVTTAQVARDMDLMRQAMNEDTLYYIGISAGTALGQTYSQLYPDRVGRMVLDGIIDILDERTPETYALTTKVDRDQIYNEGFIGECIRAGPDNCALAKPLDGSNGTETVKGLQDRLSKIFADLLDRPAPVALAEFGPALYFWRDLNDLLASTLYGPEKWPRRASAIAAYEREGNITALYLRKELATFESDPKDCPEPAEKAWGDAFLFYVCGDVYDAPRASLEQLLQLWKKMTDLSFIGGDAEFFDAQPCRQYDWKPVEVYRGDMSANLSYPILLVSTTLDPATPLSDGEKVYQQLGYSNARHLIHHAYGHTSARMHSNCTEEVKRKYFLTDELPQGEEPVNCYADALPYPPPEVQAQMASKVLYPYEMRRPPRFLAF